ncbi:MAG: hypothetical protein IT378_11095 [Sandaracinaceae bacterium]|nr:hypothetical protein [Sandaracinaceae bacterium]
MPSLALLVCLGVLVLSPVERVVVRALPALSSDASSSDAGSNDPGSNDPGSNGPVTPDSAPFDEDEASDDEALVYALWPAGVPSPASRASRQRRRVLGPSHVFESSPERPPRA